MSHLEPVETRHIVGDGWFNDDNDTRLARLHQHHGEYFDLAIFETFLDGEHEVKCPQSTTGTSSTLAQPNRSRPLPSCSASRTSRTRDGSRCRASSWRRAFTGPNVSAHSGTSGAVRVGTTRPPRTCSAWNTCPTSGAESASAAPPKRTRPVMETETHEPA